MSETYVVVHDENYAPENIVTTLDDLIDECKEREMDWSELDTTPLGELLKTGRRAFNYAYVFQKGPRKGQFKTAEELAKE